jgi:hypothetical protein
VVPAGSTAITDALGNLLERDTEVELMIERGRALAANHGPQRLRDRLTAAIGAAPSKRRAA